MNNRSSDATLVTKRDTSHGIALSASRPSRIRRVLNLKGGTEHGRTEAPEAARWGHTKHSSRKVKCAASRIRPENLTPVLNEDARSRWLGRDNVGYATIEGKQMAVLLDTGANVNMITPECVVALGLQMGPLTDLHEGGITIDQPFNYEGRPIGYVIMRCAD